MIDLDKAEALLRAEGLAPSRGDRNGKYANVLVVANTGPVQVRASLACALVASEVAANRASPDEADALAAALTRAAALCRRIEAECQFTPSTGGAS